MTGLEQIIRQIEDDAAASVVSIRQKAEEEAAQIAQEARSRGEARAQEIANQAKEQAKVSKAVRNRPQPYKSGRAFLRRNRR